MTTPQTIQEIDDAIEALYDKRHMLEYQAERAKAMTVGDLVAALLQWPQDAVLMSQDHRHYDTARLALKARELRFVLDRATNEVFLRTADPEYDALEPLVLPSHGIASDGDA